MKNQRVLILDDDKAVSSLQQSLLEEQGCDAVASNEFGEFRQLLEVQPDLILLDLMMPVDGIRVMRYLASAGFEQPILVSSAADNDLLKAVSSLANIHNLDLRGIIRKPFTPEGFLAQVRAVLDYQPSSNEISEAEIATLIDSGCLRVHYQPKFDIDLCSLTGLEALVRCEHPERGLLTPNVFLPVIERGPLLETLTEAIVGIVAQDLGHWNDLAFRPKVAINVSGKSLDNLELPDLIGSTLKQYRVDPTDITVEVTETTLEQNYVNALEVLTRLRLLGVHLSLDDFGTGYSGEDRLRGLPFTELKIDRSITGQLTESPVARQELQRQLKLCNSLNLSSVAEGVETLAQQAVLKASGCQQVQGYLLTPPLHKGDFVRWLCRGEWAQPKSTDSFEGHRLRPVTGSRKH